MKYNKIRKMDIANGPGIRVSIFMQGCSFHCEGCFSEETWDFNKGKEFTEETIKKVLELCEDKTIKGLSQAKKIIKEFKPDVVIGTGGYICGAVILAAHKQKIPTMLHESNAFPGKAVKMLASKTDVIMVSFQDAISRIP